MKRKDLTLLDGGMGTMLQRAGLPIGQSPERWNVDFPERVTAVHRQYVEAGSRVLYTNTFGVNRFRAARCGATVEELIDAGVSCAREAARGFDAEVALDVGPIGQLLEPLGTLSFREAYDVFAQVMKRGQAAGADRIVIETMSDLYEVKAAVLAARECTNLPVWVTMTFGENGRTFTGVTVPAMALTLEGLGVEAMGFNCSVGPRELVALARELRRWTDKPIIFKPNAGLPNPATGGYDMTAEEFAAACLPALDSGATIFGGCCGTTPEYIAALGCLLDGGGEVTRRQGEKRSGICSATKVVTTDGVHVIGERINPTGKKALQQALREGDMDAVASLAIAQQDAGAEILDVNVGVPGLDEAAMMAQAVRAVQAVSDLPVQIDSSDPAAIEAGLRAVNGKAAVNSVSGSRASLEAVLPLCKKYGAAVVGLCMDEKGIPQTWQERVAIAKRIMDTATAMGIPKSDIWIDCLTLTVSAQQDQAAETLRAVRYVTEELGLATVLGVSNISFGLPQRQQITVSFLTQALQCGLRMPIVNPNQEAIMDAVAAYRVLSGEDRDSGAYIARMGRVSPAAPAAAESAMPLEEAVLRGLGARVAEATRAALAHADALQVVNEKLIPALDRVGQLYEQEKLYLPQLINAANAACAGFEVVRHAILAQGGSSVSRGKIVLATVQGDIHDIGKNIVKVVLENYGYTVVDLGRDVAPETVVEAVIREDAHLLGLSALMTTTVSKMAETIAAVRKSGHECKIMVGGAVLTADYAAEIGADFYARDAKQSADIAGQVLG